MIQSKPVKGYEGRYFVTSTGDVYSLPFQVDCKRGSWLKPGRKLKPGKTKDGYRFVVLTVDGESKTVKVHRLVAEAFIGNPNNLPEINHIDKNKENNCVSNLEWCNHAYNIKYSLNKPIMQFDKYGEKIAEYASIQDASKQTGVSRTAIGNALHGLSKSAGGYCWEFCDGGNE